MGPRSVCLKCLRLLVLLPHTAQENRPDSRFPEQKEPASEDQTSGAEEARAGRLCPGKTSEAWITKRVQHNQRISALSGFTYPNSGNQVMQSLNAGYQLAK